MRNALTIADEILNLLDKNRGLSTYQVQMKVKSNYTTTRRILFWLLDKKIVRKEKGTKTKRNTNLWYNN